MLMLKVPDMTCSHCAGTVTKAVQSVDATAQVSVDLKAKTVTITQAKPTDGAAFTQALTVAGYPATVSAGR